MSTTYRGRLGVVRGGDGDLGAERTGSTSWPSTWSAGCSSRHDHDARPALSDGSPDALHAWPCPSRSGLSGLSEEVGQQLFKLVGHPAGAGDDGLPRLDVRGRAARCVRLPLELEGGACPDGLGDESRTRCGKGIWMNRKTDLTEALSITSTATVDGQTAYHRQAALNAGLPAHCPAGPEPARNCRDWPVAIGHAAIYHEDPARNQGFASRL